MYGQQIGTALLTVMQEHHFTLLTHEHVGTDGPLAPAWSSLPLPLEAAILRGCDHHQHTVR